MLGSDGGNTTKGVPAVVVLRRGRRTGTGPMLQPPGGGAKKFCFPCGEQATIVSGLCVASKYAVKGVWRNV